MKLKYRILLKKAEDDRTFEDLKEHYPNEIRKLEETLLNHMGGNDLKFLKTGFPSK